MEPYWTGKESHAKRPDYYSGPRTFSVERPSSQEPRVPVDTLIAHLKAGDPLDKFLDDFPSVSREQAEAFLDLAQVIVEEAADAPPA